MPNDRLWTPRTARNQSGPSRRGFVLGGLAATASMGLLSACSGDNASPTASGGSPKKGGTLTMALITSGTAETIVPAGAVNTPDQFRVYNLYDTLFRLDANQTVVPSLAEEATPNADASVWTFRLRKGVTWHNGKPLTADDLVYTIGTWKSAKSGGSGAVKPFIDFAKVKKVDGLTVEIPLLVSAAEFPSILTRQPLSVIPSGQSITTGGDHVGTGPFKLKEFKPGVRSIFTANESYWDGVPHVDTLVIDSSYQDETARLNALLSGAADLMPAMPFALASAQKGRGNVNVISATSPSCQSLVMNCQVKPFNDVRVRQAMKLILDREKMVDTLVSGYGKPGTDLAPYGAPNFADDLVPQYDPERARSLLKAAGQEDMIATIDTAAYQTGQVESATFFQQQAKAAGLKVRINKRDVSSYFNSPPWLSYPFSTDAYQTLVSSLTTFAVNLLWSKSPYNESHWATPESDKLLLDAMAETNPASAKDKWHAFQKLQFDTGGYVIWGNMDYVDGLAARVKGVSASPAGPLGGFRLHRAWLA